MDADARRYDKSGASPLIRVYRRLILRLWLRLGQAGSPALHGSGGWDPCDVE